MSRAKIVLDLAKVGAGLLPLVGGKAGNLGELIGGDFPVPGFCVTTQAYAQLADTAGSDDSKKSGRHDTYSRNWRAPGRPWEL